MKYDILESVRDELEKCTKCASCQAGCYTYELTASETLVARGKIRLAQGVLRGDLSISDRVANDFSQCLSCMNCQTACPVGVDTMKIFAAMKTEIRKEKGGGAISTFIFKWILPYPSRLNLLAKIVGLSSIFYKLAPNFLTGILPYSPGGVKRVTPDFLKRNLRSQVSENNPPVKTNGGRPKRVVYFSGCMTDLAYPETGVSVIERLQGLGAEVIFPKKQLCCGAPSYYNGDMETTKQLALKNIEVLKELKPDAIVYSCATCGGILGETYRKLFPDNNDVKELADKVVDFQKLLLELHIDASSGANESGDKLKVTYHDPCHLKRGMGVWKEPRELLKSLPNVEFVEMEGADRCCGGSGTFSLNYPKMSTDIGAFKANAIKKSGADIVVTACPSCQLQLSDALNRNGVKVKVMHTADLLDTVTKPCAKALVSGETGNQAQRKNLVPANK